MLFFLLMITVNTVELKTGSKSQIVMKADENPLFMMETKKLTNPELRALTPPQFLILTSPREKKVSYILLNDFSAVGNKIHALVDGGLLNPQGIAIDQHRELLYVADLDAAKIYRYQLRVYENDNKDILSRLRLVTVNVPLTIISGRSVSWLTVDTAGNLYFSEKRSNKIFKMDVRLLTDIQNDTVKPEDVITESEAGLIAANAIAQNKGETAPPPSVKNNVMFTLYDKDTDARVNLPEGVATNGKKLYWTNAGNRAKDYGEVVRGSTSLHAVKHESHIEVNMSPKAYGICLTQRLIFWSAGSAVYVKPLNGGDVVAVTYDLLNPRGCSWDSDGTIYIADGRNNAIYYFPSGSASGKNVKMVAELHDPFGVAVFTNFKKHKDPVPDPPEETLRCRYPLEFAVPTHPETVPRYYYNPFTKKCEIGLFHFKEAATMINVNQFETKGLCEEACADQVFNTAPSNMSRWLFTLLMIFIV